MNVKEFGRIKLIFLKGKNSPTRLWRLCSLTRAYNFALGKKVWHAIFNTTMSTLYIYYINVMTFMDSIYAHWHHF